jgi:hypothetical protein
MPYADQKNRKCPQINPNVFDSVLILINKPFSINAHIKLRTHICRKNIGKIHFFARWKKSMSPCVIQVFLALHIHPIKIKEIVLLVYW